MEWFWWLGCGWQPLCGWLAWACGPMLPVISHNVQDRREDERESLRWHPHIYSCALALLLDPEVSLGREGVSWPPGCQGPWHGFPATFAAGSNGQRDLGMDVVAVSCSVCHRYPVKAVYVTHVLSCTRLGASFNISPQWFSFIVSHENFDYTNSGEGGWCDDEHSCFGLGEEGVQRRASATCLSSKFFTLMPPLWNLVGLHLLEAPRTSARILTRSACDTNIFAF